MVRQRGRFVSWVIIVVIIVASVTSCVTRQSDVSMTIDDNHRIFYEIFVASFYDSDGDGIGDINGIKENLDYLNKPGSPDSLHISGIYLMPIMPSPSYHKYDVTDYYAIDPSYGTIEDFKALADECTDRNVALIIDLPINHTSNVHPWFISALAGKEPYVEYYNFSDEFASDYHKIEGTDRYYEGHFGSHMPDLNLANPAVRAQILDICRFWLDAGARGFRLDAVSWFFSSNISANVEFLAWLVNELTSYKSDVYLVGEAWSDATTIVALYESGLTSFFNFPLSQSTGAIISSVRSGNGSALSDAVRNWYAQLPENAIDTPFLTNHDHARSAGALMRDLSLQKQAAAVYLLLPGNPFIYYGEEIGMSGGSGRDENKRTPMIWSTKEIKGITDPPEGADDIRLLDAGVKEQLKDRDSLLRYYIDIIAIKNRYPGLSRGELNVESFEPTGVCAYTVTFEEQTFMVVHNLAQEPVELPMEHYRLLETIGTTDDNITLSEAMLRMPSLSSAVLESLKIIE